MTAQVRRDPQIFARSSKGRRTIPRLLSCPVHAVEGGQGEVRESGGDTDRVRATVCLGQQSPGVGSVGPGPGVRGRVKLGVQARQDRRHRFIPRRLADDVGYSNGVAEHGQRTRDDGLVGVQVVQVELRANSSKHHAQALVLGDFGSRIAKQD
jgi:hypothetical protein